MLLIPIINKILNQVKSWREVSSQRQSLKNISDHILKDVGLSRIDADREANRPFWDAARNHDHTLRDRGNSASSVDKAEGCNINCCSQN